MTFPVSGVETPFWLPIAVAFAISTLTSMGGISGAFLLLPFQVSVLGFTSPAVTPTNMIFNMVAIPGGVYRYAKEGRMVWALIWAMSIGTIFGTLFGVFIRIKCLPDPKNFKAFVGIVLAYMAYLLIKEIFNRKPNKKMAGREFKVKTTEVSFGRISFEFNKVPYSVSTYWIFFLSVIVGIIGGVYGIGGGSLIAPALIVMFGLPVYTIAGITLFNTFLTSFIGVLLYALIAPRLAPSALAVTPDWILGLFFGIGGFFGIYLGSRLQRFVPAIYIKILLAVAISFISVKYILGYF
ncbi:MAG: TSUP family transporter [candidate division Zixibacteria bacterium]|nr:TSUP family transporter [candidate division Zixibacteria bacterium]